MRSLLQLLNEGNISPEMMDAKVLQVPVKGYKDKVIHAGGQLCPDSKVAFKDKNERKFYAALDDDDESSFEYISFNDFLTNKSKYCDACLGSTSAGLQEYGAFVENFVPFLQTAEKLLTDVSFYNSVSFDVHSKWDFLVEGFYNKTALKNVPEYFIFLDKVLKKFSSLEYTNGASFKSTELELADSLKCSVIPDIEDSQNLVLKEALDVSRESFVQSLLTNTTFVLFDFNFECVEDSDSWSSEEDINLLLKVLLYPTFTFSSFAVLPQIHFLWLNNFLAYSVFDERKQVTVTSVPSKETVEIMKGLLQQNNNALNSYEKVYDISVNI